jgi:hypothetical protein
MRHEYKHNTLKTYTKIRDIQVVLSRESTREILRRGRRSGKGENIRKKIHYTSVQRY